MIGAIYNNTPSGFFDGYLDQVLVVTRAKAASEILVDASLVCYYSFDANSTYDSGPLGINGSTVNVAAAVGSGRVSDAISFTTPSSYYTFGGLRLLGIDNQPYSISVWIKPTSVSGGTIVHVSKCDNNCGTNWCLAYMGFSSSGQIVIQSWNYLYFGSLISLTGPILSTNVWTHVVNTYSTCNGIRLYLNGTLYSQSTSFTYMSSSAPNYMYLGNFPLIPCVAQANNIILMGQYYGLLDEFRLYSREITASEVMTLANP
ncbi:unnamed protein product [Rotaria sp. Silwood1]|nr:unnamed protein product [Rotaria sp. Silwood1]